MPGWSSLDARNASRWEVRRIEAAFDSLSEEQRDVLSLRRFVGLSHAEIGDQLGKSEGAIRMIQHRALARLSSFTEESSGETPA